MIYFTQDRNNGHIKIGYTSRSAEKRRQEVQPGNSTRLEVILVVEGDKYMEESLHRKFAAANVNGEWFRPVPELLRLIIDLAKDPTKQITGWPLHIYLAGKISRNDWRTYIVYGLDDLYSSNDWDNDVIELLNDQWPVLTQSIFRTHHYVGPYFINSLEAPAFDDDSHGIGLPVIEAKRSGSHMPGRDVVHQCFRSIRKADLVFAWVDQPDCYGTILEVGYALAIGKAVRVSGPKQFRDMWFAYEAAADSLSFECQDPSLGEIKYAFGDSVTPSQALLGAINRLVPAELDAAF